MKQGNRSQGPRSASEGHAGNRSGKPSRRSGVQDSAKRGSGRQGKRTAAGKQDSRHASCEDKRLGEGPVAGAGRRDSEKAHGSGKSKSVHGSNKSQGSRGSGKRQSSHGSGKAHASRSASAAAPAAKQPKHQASLPPRSAFLPVSRADMEERGWDRCDFVFVCGDAYVDHPSFGMAIITRLLEANH